MRCMIPLTGELIGPTSGNPANPVRPISLRKLLPKGLDDFAWEALSFDLDSGLAEIEIRFKKRTIPTGHGPDGRVVSSREETGAELSQRQVASENALLKVLREHTVSELYGLTGEPKLIKPVSIGGKI